MLRKPEWTGFAWKHRLTETPLFTTHEVPAGTSTINFTSGAAFGLHFLGEHCWSVDVRYMHISNAGLASPNPGVNTVQVRLGFGKFYGKK